MRFLLVGPDLESNLSLGYLASSLALAGHAAEIVPFSTGADTTEVLRRALAADAVGLSLSFQVRAPEFLELAAALKAQRPGQPVIAGGHFASCAAHELLRDFPSLDLVVLHEGERTLVELADLGERLLEGAAEIPGIVHRDGAQTRSSAPRPALAEIDALPPPDRSGPSRLVAGVPTAYIMGSRGCVRRCDYCCITTLHRLTPGPRFRRRDPENVVAELAELYHRRGVRQFVFHDDNFLVPSARQNAERLAEYERAIDASGMRDIGIVMKCGPQDLDRASLLKLKELGLLRIFLGIESGSQCGLDSIGRRQTTADTERALSLCEEHGVSSQYTMIIFHPEASIESMLEDLDFVARHPAHPLNYCRAELYAGTPLEKRMLESGRALGGYMARTYRYRDERVARVWRVGSDLFAGRCWGRDEILGHAIRLDHQIAVLSHFYDGPEVESLVRDFGAWQLRLNLETAALFRELVLACAAVDRDDAPSLADAVASIRSREVESRTAHREALCRFRERISAIVEPVIHFATATRQRPTLSRIPRHAIALVVAAGLIGCGGAQPRTDNGVAEAAPPPVDGPRAFPLEESDDPNQAPPPDAGTTVPPPYHDDDGVAEMAPPPFRDDDGVAEAAPPPVDDRP
jgi:anaerobic magnesium-protoporphyrin IX monomethyl ester cyclase